MFQITPQLYDKIKHFAKFPQTGVSLRQMVMFGNERAIHESVTISGLTLFKAKVHQKAHCLKQASSCTVRV